MEEIPKTSVGKFLKQALRKELEHLHKEKLSIIDIFVNLCRNKVDKGSKGKII